MKYCIVLYLTQLLKDNINEKDCGYDKAVIKYIQ